MSLDGHVFKSFYDRSILTNHPSFSHYIKKKHVIYHPKRWVCEQMDLPISWFSQSDDPDRGTGHRAVKPSVHQASLGRAQGEHQAEQPPQLGAVALGELA